MQLSESTILGESLNFLRLSFGECRKGTAPPPADVLVIVKEERRRVARVFENERLLAEV